MPARRWIVIGIALGVAFTSGIVWYISSRPHVLTLVVCDVGQGDAILIRTPNHADILIDGGRTDAKVLSCLGRYLPPWDRTLEIVVLTHDDSDHVGGLPAVASRYRIGQVVNSGMLANTAVYQAWIKTIRHQQIPEQIVKAGDSIDFGSGIMAQVVSPLTTSTSMNSNETSVVLRVVYGATALLLTGDAGFESEQRMLVSHQNLSAQILKIGHHGSRYATGVDFLATVRPQIALISVGANNGFGHPHPDTLGRLQAIGARVFRTDQDGDLVWVSNGMSWQ